MKISEKAPVCLKPEKLRGRSLELILMFAQSKSENSSCEN